MGGRQSRGKKVIDFLQNEMGVDKIRFPDTSDLGIKPISQQGTSRIVRAAIKYAIENDRGNVTGAQRQHHEVHRGRFQRLGI